MNASIEKLVVLGCAGAILALLASLAYINIFLDGGRESVGLSKSPTTDRLQGESAGENAYENVSEPPASRGALLQEIAAESSTDQDVPTSDVRITTPAISPGVVPETLTPLTPANDFNEPRDSRDLANIVEARDATEVADAVLSSLFVRCSFGPGRGAWWFGQNEQQIVTSVWQGGEIVYDSIVADTGTARMTGSAGATGSIEGAVDVKFEVSPSGVHFSGLLPTGDLVVTTMYGAQDESGSHAATMSRHETRGGALPHGGSQFYGTCAIG